MAPSTITIASLNETTQTAHIIGIYSVNHLPNSSNTLCFKRIRLVSFGQWIVITHLLLYHLTDMIATTTHLRKVIKSIFVPNYKALIRAPLVYFSNLLAVGVGHFSPPPYLWNCWTGSCGSKVHLIALDFIFLNSSWTFVNHFASNLSFENKKKSNFSYSTHYFLVPLHENPTIPLTRALEGGGADFALPSCFSQISSKLIAWFLPAFQYLTRNERRIFRKKRKRKSFATFRIRGV